MRCLALAFLLGLVAATVPQSASAIQVDITYSINGGSNTFGALGPLGGNTPTGGTAKVRWSMSSISGQFSSGPGSIISLVITATAATFQPAVWSWASPGSIYFGGLQATTIYGGHPDFSEYAKIYANLAAGTFSFYGLGNNGSATLTATGAEVGRALVPEPGAGVLLVLGLAAVGAGRTAWRRKVGRRA